jgi:adenylate kinase family enzyme
MNMVSCRMFPSHMYVDPATCYDNPVDIYHVTFLPATDAAVLSRLVRVAADQSDAQIQTRIAQYRSTLSHAVDSFAKQFIHNVNADQPIVSCLYLFDGFCVSMS